MTEFIQTLINASEKAACIARACVGGEDSLLIAEKSQGEANVRFDKDFKTIADVLAQEAAKQTIILKYPLLDKHVRGEECSEINGQPIKILETIQKTNEALSSLVSPDLAKKMAQAAHSDVKHILSFHIPENMPLIDTSDVGIWIDPIDATAEFIAGVRGEAKANGGLDCVTVLIGAYLRSSGEPIVGVINQPFYKKGKGRIFWGFCYNNVNKWGGTHIDKIKATKSLLISNGDDEKLKSRLSKSKYQIGTAPGAGYKLMKVGLGEADAYILSKGTTFRWDTCAPHAILKAKGGDILAFSTQESIKYNVPESKNTNLFCNHEGIVAYSDTTIWQDFLKPVIENYVIN